MDPDVVACSVEARPPDDAQAALITETIRDGSSHPTGVHSSDGAAQVALSAENIAGLVSRLVQDQMQAIMGVPMMEGELPPQYEGRPSE
jgi:hypothetical protein